MRDYLISTSFELSREMASDIAARLSETLSLNASHIPMDSNSWTIRVHGAHDETLALGWIKGVEWTLNAIG